MQQQDWRTLLAPSPDQLARIEHRARKRYRERLAARWLVELLLRLWQALAALAAPIFARWLAQRAASHRCEI